MPPVSLPAVVLPEPLRRRAVDVARAALPNEACGLLAAAEPADWAAAAAVAVVDLVPVANSLASPSAFALDGKSMLDAEARIEADGRRSIGVYHSHPASEARPSVRDVDDAAAYDPDHMLLHLIASLQGFAPTVRAWRFGASVAECRELAILERARD